MGKELKKTNMTFIDKNENYYKVDYDKEKLKEILEKLKDYSYATTGHGKISGDSFTCFLATNNNIKKRVISYFSKTEKGKGSIIDPESIIHHKDDNNDYVTFNYTYKKLPDLYSYIEIILNDDFQTFKKNIEVFNRTFNSSLYAYSISDQLVLEGILNYINSNELTNNNSIIDNKSYDYKGLNELYKETLNCFKFNLVAIKEYLKEPIPTDINKLQLKK